MHLLMRDMVTTARKTLMLVEDNPEMRAMLSEVLFQSGFMVYSSDDARSACDLARILRPAVILCDVVMPAMSGFEAAERLRTDPSTSRIPVILMTGHSYSSERRAGAAGWLIKPFTSEQLTTAIAQSTRAASALQ